MASKSSKDTTQLSFAEIVAERERLKKEQEAIDAQLSAAKDSAFQTLLDKVDDFNATFDTNYTIMVAPAPKAPRKCSNCGETGHSKKSCPKPTVIHSDAASA
jgi:hypothetical protein